MSTRFAALFTAGLLAGSLAGSLAACGSDATSSAPTDGSEPRTLTVFAASSLKATFEELAATFEDEHPGVTVAFNFAGSSDLVAQIQQGAPADVFASADTANMEKLGADALAPKEFATNVLAIAVPTDNPAQIDSLDDLAGDGVQLVVCAPEVPCGAAAAKVEAEAGLDWKPVSEEQSVTDVLGKVGSGEADAGLVYVTDVKAAGARVEGIAFATDVVNTYPIASVASARQAELAEAWIKLVLGTAGQKVFAAAGFGRA